MTLNCPTIQLNTCNEMYLDFLEAFNKQDKKNFAKTVELIKIYWAYKTPFDYIEWSDLFRITQPAFELVNKIRTEWQAKGEPEPETVSKELKAALLVTETLWNFVPPICVHENIIPALMQTDVKPMEDPEYALPYFLFLLPKNFKSICNLPNSKYYNLNFQAAFVACLPDYIGVAYLSKTTVCYGSYEWSSPFTLEDENCQEEDLILEKFMKNLILTLTYESKYVTDESIKASTKGKGFNSKATAKPFQVRWLGKNYTQIKQRTVYKDNKDSTENKRFVRPHWRRGHWHTVCCGAKHKQRKQQWYKPVFVNVGSD